MMMTSASSSLSSASVSMSPSSSSTLQEGDGIRKSGPILLLGLGKKASKCQSAYAVLSERALELHESEKAHRKKKGTRSIVDLSKCFNVSQQNCPRSKASCVCLLMPDECFMFRADSGNETTEWFGTVLSAVISARALHLGRPVFANEFFESVWDVTVCPQPPKLKRIPAPPNTAEFANSPNICAKVPELSGRKQRLCFYPHTIILCKVGIEPAHSGLPKSGIPPFRTMDFVEFSRHFIAQFGPVDKYFLMRIGRTSPMGACEVWVQCESEECAQEVNRKLQEIIQRETEKKQQALMAIRGQQQQQSSHHSTQSQSNSLNYSSCSASSPSASASFHNASGTSPAATTAASTACGSPGEPAAAAEADLALPFAASSGQIEQLLEPISEDEALATCSQPTTPPPVGGRKKHSSLSQSAKEKRLELRNCKAKVDSLEEAEKEFQHRQMLAAQQQQQQQGSKQRYMAVGSNSSGRSAMDTDASRTAGTTSLLNRPTCLMGQPTYQFRRRGSSGAITAEIGARSKSLSLEEQQQAYPGFRPFGPATGRLWTMDKADSLLLLGYNPTEPEETEDSGGTLRMIPLDQEGSRAASRSSSSLNLASQNATSGLNSPNSSSAGQLVETYVECHVPAGIDGEEDSEEEEEEDSSTEDEADIGHVKRQQRRRKSEAAKKEMRRRQQRQLAAGSIPGSGQGSLDAGTEADQSCSCSSSVASSSGHDDQLAIDGTAMIKPSSRRPPLLVQQQSGGAEYTLMDKISCSSDSFSHLAVPPLPAERAQQQQQQQQFCPEEICSYTSDSGDSCYSSMYNGNGQLLNPRAFSFSSTSERGAAPHHHFGAQGKLGGGGAGGCQQQQQHPAAAKWIAAAMGGHRNYLFNQPPAHFSPPKSHCCSNSSSSGGVHPSQMLLDSSSSSRFSMETSLITPLEEDERQVTFADEEQRDRLGPALPLCSARDGGGGEAGDELLRKRAFSLGSKSWLTKPFRKLSSAHGTPSSSSGRQQRSSCGGASRSGSSSLVGSMHADLCSVQEQHQQGQKAHLGSSSSFASSSAAGPIGSSSLEHHTRSDSIGSSHSAAALSLPGRRKKPSGGEEPNNEDLVELEFMPGKLSGNPFANRSAQCVATLAGGDGRAHHHQLRGRTNSCDDHNTTIAAGSSHVQHQHVQQQQQQVGSGAGSPYGSGSGGGMPRALGSAGALNHQQGQGVWPQKQRLRPSESFIRSIQQQQRELQRARQQKQRHQRLKSDFPLQEVQCFIAPAERDKIDAITTAARADSLSLRSQRSGSGSCSQQQQFDTIDEQQQQQQHGHGGERPASRPHSRRSLTSRPSMLPHSPVQSTLNEEDQQQQQNVGGVEEGDYVLGPGEEMKPKTTAAVVKA